MQMRFLIKVPASVSESFDNNARRIYQFAEALSTSGAEAFRVLLCEDVKYIINCR